MEKSSSNADSVVSKPITAEQADRFAAAWIAGWNAHDLDQILSHYADDIEFRSPFALEFTGGDGTVRGKAELRAYWEAALAQLPDLTFKLESAVPGNSSISLVYQSVRNLLAVETMEFNASGKVCRVTCHYRPLT